MKTILAFHSKEKVKTKYLNRVIAHKQADEIILEAIKRGLLVVDFNLGKVFSTRFANKEMGVLNLKGYKVATLHLDGQRKQIKLHRVIWIAKNGLIPKGFVIDHINGLKADNRLINLRLADSQLNSQNRRSYKGEKNPAAKINSYIAAIIRNNFMNKTKEELAQAYNISKSLVIKIQRGELWQSNF